MALAKLDGQISSEHGQFLSHEQLFSQIYDAGKSSRTWRTPPALLLEACVGKKPGAEKETSVIVMKKPDCQATRRTSTQPQDLEMFNVNTEYTKSAVA